PGSTTARLVVHGRAGSPGLLFAGSGPAHRLAAGTPPRLLWLLEPPTRPLLSFRLGGGASVGTFRISLGRSTLALAGQTVWLQAMLLDPSAKSRVAATNGLELSFGR